MHGAVLEEAPGPVGGADRENVTVSPALVDDFHRFAQPPGSLPRGVGPHGFRLPAQGLRQCLTQTARLETPPDCIETFDGDGHRSRSSHWQRSQVFRSSSSMTLRMWNRRVPWRKRMAGVTPTR